MKLLHSEVTCKHTFCLEFLVLEPGIQLLGIHILQEVLKDKIPHSKRQILLHVLQDMLIITHTHISVVTVVLKYLNIT